MSLKPTDTSSEPAAAPEARTPSRVWLRTSVLIPSFGRPQKLEKCLVGLSKQTVLPDEVLVVWQAEDRATHDAIESARSWAPFDLTILHSPEAGVVPSENLALASSTGDVILLIDDDAIPRPEWIERHLAHYNDQTVGAVGGPADDFYEDGTPFPKRTVEPLGRLRWYGALIGNMFDHAPEWSTRAPIEVDHLVGYNLSLRRAAFDRFEAGLRRYWQLFEADACLQVKRRGFRVLFDFANIVEHHPTNTAYVDSRSGNLEVKVYNAAFNHAFVLGKHSPWYQRPVRLAYMFLVGSVGAPGVAASLVAIRRFGNWRREATILGRTMRSHLEGWKAGTAKRRTVAKVGQGARTTSSPRILSLATQGSGGDDESRLNELLGEVAAHPFPFDHRKKTQSFFKLLRTLFAARWDLVVMEGTGVGGGLPLLLANLLRGTRYVVSSGDAAGPFLALRLPLFRPIFNLYERMLYGRAAGFIGWTPYLVGRALSFGARRGITAAGWAPFEKSRSELRAARTRVRAAHGIPEDATVFGIAGALVWNSRIDYCYGAELVRALKHVTNPNVFVLIVGDGNGRPHLERLACAAAGKRIIFTGRVPRAEVPDYLAAMDAGSLPQSVDQVGSFRYTTKLSEYLAAELPVVTGQIPLAYDLDEGWLWRIAGDTPWHEKYIAGLAKLMNSVTAADLAGKRSALPRFPREFDRSAQQRRVTAFISDLVSSGD